MPFEGLAPRPSALGTASLEDGQSIHPSSSRSSGHAARAKTLGDNVELTLVRHGESEANVSGRWQGQGDSHLSERGRQQASALARRLVHREFDRIVASDLSRARETAKALDLPFTTDEGWREINVGAWEGLTRAEVAERFPEEILRLKAGATDVPVGGGESWDDLRARVRRNFETLRTDHEDKNVLLVSHGGAITTLISEVLGISPTPPRPLGRIANTGISTLRMDTDQPRLVSFNDTAHDHPCSEWARGRRDAGDGVLTLVSVAPTPPPRDGSGRARGNASLVSMEQLTDRYGRFHHVSWVAGGGAAGANAASASTAGSNTQGCATVLAERAGIPVAPPVSANWEHLAALASSAAGRSVAVVLASDTLRDLASEILSVEAETLIPPSHGTVSHVVFDGEAKVLADYAVSVRQHEFENVVEFAAGLT